MKYDRKTLLAAAELAIKHTQQQQLREHTERQRKYRAAVTDWNSRYADSWRAAIRTLNRKLKNSEPIVHADLPHEWSRSHSVAAFSDTPVTEFKPYVPGTLAMLVKVLKLVSDDTVTTAALRDLGVSSDTMRECLVHMAAGSVRA